MRCDPRRGCNGTDNRGDDITTDFLSSPSTYDRLYRYPVGRGRLSAGMKTISLLSIRGIIIGETQKRSTTYDFSFDERSVAFNQNGVFIAVFITQQME